jgi:DNA-binding Lrp family transcriptional regulator
LGISEDVVKEYTAKLKQKGIIKRVGNNRTGYWDIKEIKYKNIDKTTDYLW